MTTRHWKDQPRWPKGGPRGGEWRGMGAVSGKKADKQLAADLVTRLRAFEKEQKDYDQAGVHWGMETYPLTPEQRQFVVKVVQDFTKEFPQLKKPIEIHSISNAHMSDMSGIKGQGVPWGITTNEPGLPVYLNSETMWNDRDLINAMESMRQGPVTGMIAAQAGRSPAQYRRIIIEHELAHHLNLDQDGAEGGEQGEPGPISEIAWEPVTPRQMGFGAAESGDSRELDQQVPRWLADSLDHKSAYAIQQNPYEFTAEALIDALVNRDKASEASKRILAAAKEAYG